MPLIEEAALLGAFLWGGAALLTGGVHGLAPSEIPFVFTVMTVIGALIAATGWTPARIDIWLFGLAAALYVLTPVALTAWLLRHNEAEDRDPENPKTIT